MISAPNEKLAFKKEEEEMYKYDIIGKPSDYSDPNNWLRLTWNFKFQCKGKFHHALKIFDFIEVYKAWSAENWYN